MLGGLGERRSGVMKGPKEEYLYSGSGDKLAVSDESKHLISQIELVQRLDVIEPPLSSAILAT